MSKRSKRYPKTQKDEGRTKSISFVTRIVNFLEVRERFWLHTLCLAIIPGIFAYREVFRDYFGSDDFAWLRLARSSSLIDVIRWFDPSSTVYPLYASLVAFLFYLEYL